MSEPTAVMTNAVPPLSAGRILRALLAGACTGSLLTTGGMFLGADRSAPAVTLLFTLPYVLVGTFIAFSVGIVALIQPACGAERCRAAAQEPAAFACAGMPARRDKTQDLGAPRGRASD